MSTSAHGRGLRVEDEKAAAYINEVCGIPKACEALLGAPTWLPEEALALAQNLVEFRDQGGSSSCTGHAVCRVADARLRLQGKIVPYGSPLQVYSVGRKLARKSPTEPLRDDGAYTRFVILGAKEWGVGPESAWRLTPENLNAELPPDVLQRASAWKLEEVYRVQTFGLSRVESFANALAKGFPLVAETWTDSAFDSYRGDGVIPAPKTMTGAHLVGVLGYRTRNGKREFLIANSWARWGLANSLGWVSEEWVMATMAAYAFTLTVGPSTGGASISVHENTTLPALEPAPESEPEPEPVDPEPAKKGKGKR